MTNGRLFRLLPCRSGEHFELGSKRTEQVMANQSTTSAAKAGIGFGTALAITISWSANKSILWAILHGLLSWFYVIYYAIKHA